MAHVQLRFYAELNDFLPAGRRQRWFSHPVADRTAVKDLIESQGVPHTEIDLILVNGEPAEFSHRIRDGDRVSVYPVFESLDVQPLQQLRPEPLREPRFVADVHLGKLARNLRLLGFDCRYRSDASDTDLVATSLAERRIILTRDLGLLKRRAVTHGYYVRETEPDQQTVEVLRRFDLFRTIEPFSRCLRCNGPLAPVPKQAIEHRLLPKTRRYYDAFYQCQSCDRIYWKGSHYRHMLELVQSIAGTDATQEDK